MKHDAIIAVLNSEKGPIFHPDFFFEKNGFRNSGRKGVISFMSRDTAPSKIVSMSLTVCSILHYLVKTKQKNYL